MVKHEMIQRDVTIRKLMEREDRVSHEIAEIVQGFFYERHMNGLEVLVKNLDTVLEYANNCMSCMKMLEDGGDIYEKLRLMVEYLSHDGMFPEKTREFADDLAELTEQVQEEVSTGEPESSNPDDWTEDERLALRNMSAMMDINLQRYKDGMLVEQKQGMLSA